MYHAVCKEYIPGGDKMNNDQVDEYAATWSPMNRVGQPIDIARVVAFLASQDGEWVNGKVIGIGTFPLSHALQLCPQIPLTTLKMVPPACKAVEENDTQFLFFSNHLSLYPSSSPKR
jgi:hypothetical protein